MPTARAAAVALALALSFVGLEARADEAAPSPPSVPPPLPTAPTAPIAPPGSGYPELTTLRILRDKGVITAAEFESAMRDLGSTSGTDGAGDANTVVLGKWSTTMYGFLKGDFIYDSTQSFNDLAGAGLVERPDGHPPPPPAAPINYRGEHPRMQFSLRDSRLGFRMRGPQTAGLRPSALLEMNFFGEQSPVGTGAGTVSEAAFFTSPIPRIRHAYVRLETPIVDVLIGQTWHVFGWQNAYHPASVQAQGLPGELYSRAPQIRISKTLATSSVNVELAAAALRPPQRDSAIPDLEGGVRVAFTPWTGLTTAGATGTAIMPASLAVSGNLRTFVVPEFDPLPKQSVNKTTSSVALDAFIPILSAAKDKPKGNSLSLSGELVFGRGVADLYTNSTGGVAMPTVANNTGLNPPPTYPQNVDDGMVVFDLDGNLHAVQWTTLLVGLQYYLPALDGKVWLAANYSHMESSNAGDYTRPYAATLPDPQSSYYVSAAAVRDSIDFFDVSVFGQVAAPVRMGLEYANYSDHYVDGTRATNHRVQFATIWTF